MTTEELDAIEARAKAATPGVVYFVQAPDTGFDDYETLQQALDAAEETISDYRDEACDGWSEEITSLRVGVITHDVEQFDLKKKEDCGEDDYWPCPDCDEMCDYRMDGADIVSLLAEAQADRLALLTALRTALRERDEARDALKHIQTDALTHANSNDVSHKDRNWFIGIAGRARAALATPEVAK